MRRRPRPGVAFAVLCLAVAYCWCARVPRAAAGQRVTDTDLQARFRRSHSVMEEQLGRLRAILDAFLLGDADAIQQHADEIGKEMLAVSRTFPPDPGSEAEQWAAMADIVKESQLLQKAARAGQYGQAHQHYAVLTSRCMACHQLRRATGKFATPQPSPAEEPATGGERGE